MATLQTVIDELEKLFKVFNQRFYNEALQKPVITIQANRNKKLALGWCTTKKIWRDRLQDKVFYEINLTPEFLYLDIYEICATLLHEMAHLANLQRDIKDCSRGNTYHNQKFKEMAERFGLEIDHHEKYGWTITRLSDETHNFIAALAIDPASFALYRHSPALHPKPGKEGKEEGEEEGSDGEEKPTKPKAGWRQYYCPTCNQKIRASKDVNVICGKCMEPMMKKED